MNTTLQWAPSPEHPGYMAAEIKHGNCTIQIFRPELDKAERTKREIHIKAVAESVLASYYKRKENTP